MRNSFVRGARELAYRVDARGVQLALRGGPYVEQVAHRGLPYDLAVVLPRYHRDGIGLLVVAAELGEDLVPRHPDRHADAELGDHALAYLAGYLGGGEPEAPAGARDVEPSLVGSEGLYAVGVIVVDLPGSPRHVHVEPVVRGHDDEAGACLPRLPQRHRGLDAGALGYEVLREHDAVARLLVAADDHGLAAQLGPCLALDLRVAAVYVAVQDVAVWHNDLLPP